MAEDRTTVELRLGPQGRIVIPASLRRIWQISTGEVLMARLEDDRLILEKPSAVVQRAKGRFAALRGQPSLADELIADRRREAGQEAAS
jgi:bifunctional DNA-binding transcriptional regulator/antitoxin component of YhaV-PrlF toxin-antitoxin module